ncbi:hypothetical protein FQA39_LY06924 [Lamprigera yunnana]|nr:hypothetical protein FQA39_LY06924 [Lamprigera yunnana]
MLIAMSAYLEKLQQKNTDVAARYLDKIRVIGSVDPYTLSSADLNYRVDAIPPISSIDILSYLVLTHSFYTKNQMEAYKSLQVYKYFKAGFVQKVRCKRINDMVVIAGKTFDTMWNPRQIGSKTLTFEMIEEKKILKIEDMPGNEVYLGGESVSEVWSLESVLKYRLSYSSGSNFKYFYEDVIRAVAEMSGDVKINIYNIINRLSEKYDNVCCILEVLLFMPEKALFDVQLKRRIQEQEIQFIKKMWMLYAEDHWTKAIDLKSAVERLYEKLGALEFDADHEAIYGMERYYTVQQCEELQDKYKIRRKVCRKFLKGKTCSQCLVKRINEIRLRHFLDTINEYIKDLVIRIHHHHQHHHPRYLKQWNKMVKIQRQQKKNQKKAKVEALLHLFHNFSKNSLNHSLKLNTIFSSNFCSELSDRFLKGIQLFSNNLEEYF